MSSPVHNISPDSTLHDAEESMRTLGISSLAVVDTAGVLVGVVSNSDIVRSGLRNATRRPDAALLSSAGTVESVMATDVISLDADSSMIDAAKLMVDSRVHRVFVATNGETVGVVSTWDMMAAVEAVRIAAPVSDYMSTPVFTVRSSETIGMATERLGKAHVTGLLVVDESEWPVGVFGQREAILAGDTPHSASVESVMNAAILTLPDRCALHNVARQARATNARRVAVMHGQTLAGIMTGVDFAKAVV